MIERSHEKDGVRSTALWSDCGNYRYRLSRRWGAGTELLYIMLNPSKATEVANDPTIERCQRRAVQLGFKAFTAVNLFGYCATHPQDLKAQEAPIGPDTDSIMAETADAADFILCAWGVHGAHLDRGVQVRELLGTRPLHTLGLTKHGHPRHPLYVPYSIRPQHWEQPTGFKG